MLTYVSPMSSAVRPTSASAFRVNLEPIDYYNFDFRDDGKWQSYRLESPDQEHSVYGYVERGTLQESQIRPSPDRKSVPLMLALKFPEGATSSNQVIIERLVHDGWVEKGEAP